MLGVVRARPDQYRACPGDRTLRIRRSLRVLVGELQPVVQTLRLATEQFGPSPFEHFGVADTHVGDAVVLGDVDESTHVGGVNRRR